MLFRSDEEEEQDPLQGVSFASLGLSSGSSDDEQELELREFEVDPSEEDDFSDPFSNPPKSSLNNLGSEVDKLSTSEEKSNLSPSETSDSNLESEPTRVEFKEEIFRSDYVGKREPWTYVAKEKEVVKPPQPQPRVSQPEVAPRKVQEPKPTPRPQVVSTLQLKTVVKPQSVVQRPQVQPQTQIQANDKTVRMVNEDFVSYCRRNLRVQEQVALGYFSPSEIESAVRQGKVLRKGGVLIFAHS